MKKRAVELQKGESFLLTLAENTSGMFILPETADEMELKAANIAKIIDSNYVVTYTPKRPLSESLAGEERIIEVSSRKPGFASFCAAKIDRKNKLISGCFRPEIWVLNRHY